jgi:hypothetical protein
MKRLALALLSLLFLTTISLPILASVGVGVGTGTITVDETLRPGESYTLPEILVFNTGDVASEYGMSIEWGERDGRANPPKEWFSFTPETFFLEPGESQSVQTRMVLPLKDVIPDEYFAFVVAQPITESQEGVTSIGVAAGSKLYFTVGAANLIQAIYYKVKDIFLQFHPYSTILLSLTVLVTLFLIFKKKFKIEVVKKDSSKEE